MGVFENMNQNQKNYLMSKMYDVQFLLEEKELEKKEINVGLTEEIKMYKKKITRFLHAIKDENEDYLANILGDEELKRFDKIV